MYVPSHFAESRVEVLHQLIHARPLATLVTLNADGLNANHIPFEIDPNRCRWGPYAAMWPAPIRFGVLFPGRSRRW